jgi:hypothetical protein
VQVEEIRMESVGVAEQLDRIWKSPKPAVTLQLSAFSHIHAKPPMGLRQATVESWWAEYVHVQRWNGPGGASTYECTQWGRNFGNW